MHKINLLQSFQYKEKCTELHQNRKKHRQFESLTKNSLNLFLRIGDSISISPQIKGSWEPVLASFLKFAASKGYSDFLIDIGANVGLTSCQSGRFFKEVHMFEPNPHCFKILEVNSFFALEKIKYHLYKFGLGDRNKKAKLMVPKKNWGGAFIHDQANSYSDKILAKKDGFHQISKKNYYNTEIIIKKSSDELKKIFKGLVKKTGNAGVIKIDVEGYENVVLKGIAESMNQNLKIIIIFENHDPNFSIKKCESLFKGKAKLFKLETNYPSWEKFSRGFKYLSRLFNKEAIHYLKVADHIHAKEDLVLVVE
jgi:FkbM family methyltransferase